MDIKIKLDETIEEKVPAQKIHGKFPYKKYLKIQGINVYGDYIAIVGNRDIPDMSNVIVVKDKESKVACVNRPNAMERYKVKTVSILDVNDTNLRVFRVVGEK